MLEKPAEDFVLLFLKYNKINWFTDVKCNKALDKWKKIDTQDKQHPRHNLQVECQRDFKSSNV